LAKAKIVRQIGASIDERKLTQLKAADLLEVDQGDLSRLLRGRVRGFSLERLMKMLMLLDLDVEITLRPIGLHSSPSSGRLVVHGPNTHDLPVVAAPGDRNVTRG
jgi:predicted XRE-type DNA-binding protein